MLNWSRVTRTAYRAFWWFLFPLTVANSAAYTEPAEARDDGTGARHSPIHRPMVAVWTAVFTAGYVLWLFALIESLPRKLSGDAIRLLEFLLTAVLVIVILRRIIKAKSTPVGPHAIPVGPQRGSWVIQLLVVLFVGGGLLVVQPAAERIDGDPRAYTAPQTWVSSCWNVPEGMVDCANRVDVLSGYVLVSSGLAVIGLGAVALLATRRRRARSSLRATFILSIALFLMNVVFAGLRNAVDWISGYLENIPALAGNCQFDPNVERFRELGCLAETDARQTLLPFHLGRDWPVYDLMPVGFMWLLVLIALCFVARWLYGAVRHGERWIRRRYFDAPTPNDRFERQVAAATKVHRFVGALPWVLRWPAVIACVYTVVAAVCALWITTGHQTDSSSAPWLVLGGVHLTSLLVPIVVIAVAFLAPVRTAVSTVGDVIGYWPRGAVALSGLSYTEEVSRCVEQIVEDADGPIVLVGHSQGSIVCYTALTRLADATTEDELTGISLVTCGSPLKTLYTGFFPRYFPPADFIRLSERLGGRWRNAWRITDPIASPFLDDGDIKILPTLDYREKVNAHSNYWTEAQQREAVASLLAKTSPSVVEPPAI